MRLIHLPTFWTVLLDIMAWFLIHMGVVFWAVQIPVQRFDPDGFFFRPRSWEQGGAWYQRIFKVKRWKAHVPDGAEFMKDRGFPKKTLQDTNTAYLHAFMLETCRAEMTHWIIVFFAPFFFLWNRFWVGVFMIFYALAENLPLILVQRYNRCRFMRILQKKSRVV